RICDAVAVLLGVLQAALALDIERRPWPMQPVCEPFGVAHEAGGARVLVDADENALACGPGPRNGSGPHLSKQLLINPIRCAAKGKLAKRRQIGGREKVFEGAFRLSGYVDFSLFETLDQIVRREIDEFDGVRTVEH